MLNVKRGRAFELKEVSDSGSIAGYGSVFGNVDQGFDVVEPGAFDKTLKERGLPKMLWGHDFQLPPIGKWETAKEDDYGLLLKGKLNLDMQLGNEVHSALKMETLEGLSIGYITEDADFDRHGVQHLKEVVLFEVSVVTFPMNELARVDSVKDRMAQSSNPKRVLAGILREAGFSRTQAEALVAAGYDGLLALRDADDQVDDENDVLTAETFRII